MCIFFGFLDINECMEQKHICDHFCTNTIGSYNCSCRDGYYIHQDEKTCLGKAVILSCKIFFSFFSCFKCYHLCFTKTFLPIRLIFKLKWRCANQILGKILIFTGELRICVFVIVYTFLPEDAWSLSLFTVNAICRRYCKRSFVTLKWLILVYIN